jgi:hypothetical protein
VQSHELSSQVSSKIYTDIELPYYAYTWNPIITRRRNSNRAYERFSHGG